MKAAHILLIAIWFAIYGYILWMLLRPTFTKGFENDESWVGNMFVKEDFQSAGVSASPAAASAVTYGSSIIASSTNSTIGAAACYWVNNTTVYVVLNNIGKGFYQFMTVPTTSDSSPSIIDLKTIKMHITNLSSVNTNYSYTSAINPVGFFLFANIVNSGDMPVYEDYIELVDGSNMAVKAQSINMTPPSFPLSIPAVNSSLVNKDPINVVLPTISQTSMMTLQTNNMGDPAKYSTELTALIRKANAMYTSYSSDNLYGSNVGSPAAAEVPPGLPAWQIGLGVAVIVFFSYFPNNYSEDSKNSNKN
jgi:hypothetical protein